MAAYKRKMLIPRPLRRLGRAAYEIGRGEVLDAAERLRGARPHPLTPPRRLWRLVTVNSLDFHRSGLEFREFLTAKGLRPEHRVLDVGCGIGRLAIALTDYLSDEGSYDGFDIMPVAIRWCRNITARRPNFRFRLIDVKSGRYHRGGAARARDFVFPYPDASFDFVVLSSVFTHMLPADMLNYLSEIARVLKPGGRCVISYYLMTEARRAALSRPGWEGFAFRHRVGGAWAEVADQPEAAIALDEAEVLAAYPARGLRLVEQVSGHWAEAPCQSQDVLIGEKA